jgi:iron complex outermembrane receptor protein
VNGRQPNSGQRANGQAVGGSYLFPGGFAGIAVSRSASLYHIPGFGSAASNTRIDLEQTKLTGKGEYRPDAAAVEAIRYWFGVTDYKHDEIGIGDDGVDGVQATFKNKEQEARIETQLAPVNTGIGPLATALGAQVGHQQLSAGGEAQELIAPSQTRSFAGYIFNELALSDTLKAQLAGRIERVKVEGTAAEFPADFLGTSGAPVEFGATRVFAPKSASFGLLRTLPHGLVAGATAQYVERAPRALELFAKGAHDAPGTFEIGNSSLSIERARTVELSLRRPRGDWRFEATAYHTRFSGFIFKRLTGAMCGDGFDTCGNGDPANELTQVVYSQNDATFRGVELSTQLDVAPLGDGVFGIDGQFDVVRATFADGSNVPRIPPMRAGGGVFWRSAEWHARVGLLHAFAQTDIVPGETTTAGYNLVKAVLSYRHRLPPSAYGAREFVLGIVGDNLLNENVRNVVSFRKDQVLAPGRGVRLFAEVKY